MPLCNTEASGSDSNEPRKSRLNFQVTCVNVEVSVYCLLRVFCLCLQFRNLNYIFSRDINQNMRVDWIYYTNF